MAATCNKREALPQLLSASEFQIPCHHSWLPQQVRVTARVLVMESLSEHGKHGAALAACTDLAAEAPPGLTAQGSLWVSLCYVQVLISLLAWRKAISKAPAGQNFRLNVPFVPKKALRNQQLPQKQGISLCCEWKTPQIMQLSEGTDASNGEALSLLQWHDIRFLKFQYSKRSVWKACCCLTCSRNIWSDTRTYCSVRCKKAQLGSQISTGKSCLAEEPADNGAQT